MNSKTTQETTLPPESAEEIQMNKMFTEGYMPMFMGQAGYEMSSGEKDYTEYPEYQQLQESREQVLKNVNESEGVQRDAWENMLKEIDKKEEELKTRAAKESSFSMRKLGSPRLERIRSEFGPDSTQYKEAQAAEEALTIESDDMKRATQRLFMEKTQKFLRGDFSITPEQAQLIEQNMAPQRAALTKMYDEMEEITDENVNAVMDKYTEEAETLKMETDQLLGAIGEQISKGEENLETALQRTIDTRSELMRMGIEDFSGEMTKKVASNAAAMGRDPSDPAYQQEIQKSVSREIERGELQLAEIEARGVLGIKSRAEEQRLGLAGQRLDIAQRRGAERIGLATGLERERGQRRLGIAEARGGALTGLEQQAANLRFQVGGGMAPQQLGAAGQSMSLQNALAQQRLANLQAAGQAPFQMGGRLAQLRGAQPTTTTTKPFSFADLLGIGGGVAGIAGGVMGARAAGAQADYYRTAAQNQFPIGG
jgi:hypothetical protein